MSLTGLFAEASNASPWNVSQVMGLSLWLGLAILTLALLILARTRWGQAKPLGKCVALSLFAHVLLGGYAYGTKLIFTVPLEPQPEVAPLKMVELETEPEEEPKPEERQTIEPWNQFAEADVPDPAPTPNPVIGVATPQASPTDFNTEPMQASSELPTQTQPQATPRAAPAWTEVNAQGSPVEEAVAATELERPEPSPRSVARSAPEPFTPILPPLDRPESTIDLPSVDHALSSNNPVTLQEIFDTPTAEQNDLVSGIDQLLETTRVELPRADAPRVQSTPEVTPVATAVDQQQQIIARALGEARTIDELLKVKPNRRRLGDGAPLPPLYQLRDAQQRSALVLPLGGTPETEEAVNQALAWLAAVQEADGRWDASRFGAGDDKEVLGQTRQEAGAKADTGVTALAILAFLAADNTHLEGEYRDTVQRALEFLLGSQAADGNLFGKAEFFAQMYCHGMATLAISEAFAITGDPRLRSAVEAAIRYTRQAQHPQTGGWRYQPNDRGDMSQFGWQVLALRSAEQAGIAIPESTRLGMHRFIDSVSSGTHSGLCSYREGEKPTATMTAEGMTCRYFLDYGRTEPTMAEASGMILRGDGEAAGTNLYYIYYATLAMYQRGGTEWEVWNDEMQRSLLGEQQKSGDLKGSWNPDTRWGGYGGRVYSTAMATLSLEVYYRYLPLYRLNEETATSRRGGNPQDREAAVRIPGAGLVR